MKWTKTNIFQWMLVTCLCVSVMEVRSFSPPARIQVASSTGRSKNLQPLFGSKKKGAKLGAGGKSKANHEKWQPFFDQLSRFKDEHGHIDVKEEENPALFNWIEEQHKAHLALQMGRKTKLTKKRAVALEQLGVLSSTSPVEDDAVF
mmetsp:Transcript_5091/g.7628  ORF Transcript_5091/g.7628 Transcript_5091/m.7628 type:complete len:147 (+) Transcript_5091:121-561(+)